MSQQAPYTDIEFTVLYQERFLDVFLKHKVRELESM